MNTRRITLAGLAKFVAALLVVAVIYYTVLYGLELSGVPMPYPPNARIVSLKQGWTEKEAQRYHGQSQGTKILPLEWFLALEQPNIDRILPLGKLADRDYLGRFGFLYEHETKTPGDRRDLPIGFAVEEKFVAPYASPPIPNATPVVGLTCAACHTGRIDLEDPKTHLMTGVLIEGGSAMIDLNSFQKAVGLSLAYTVMFPERFRRFAREVLGEDAKESDPRWQTLEADLNATYQAGLAALNYANAHNLYPITPGFSRTDALGLIGNRVFSVLDLGNQSIINGPVNFPHLWDTPWFDWVQYNASIRTPLARNIGEALGVGAVVNLSDSSGTPYDSSVNLAGLSWMEDLLGGQNPFEGLQPPRWEEKVPTILGEAGQIDPLKSKAGQELYAKHCLGCHGPPRDQLKADLAKQLKADPASKEPTYFPKDPEGSTRRFLKVPVIDLYQIGTDANQALNFYRRVAVTPLPAQLVEMDDRGDAARSETISASTGLYRVTSFIRRLQFQQLGLLAPSDMDADKAKLFNADPDRVAKRDKLDRFRHVSDGIEVGDPQTILQQKGMEQVIIANLGYKARPLDGIWATPPYLHNGSVPSLYHLLLPVDQRPPSFYLGSRKFDPKHVGYVIDEVQNAFKMDTSLSGNLNTGHEYRNLSLEEIEAARSQAWDGHSSREKRWAKVLGLMDEAALDRLSDQERWVKIRETSRTILTTPNFKGFRGVFGVEFADEERWQLVEYLKTL